jgi:hypothetical protein
MKLYTNIRHLKPKTDEYCTENLYKENWGEGKNGTDWRMTCWKCGFVQMIDHPTLIKWQYCDNVV